MRFKKLSCVFLLVLMTIPIFSLAVPPGEVGPAEQAAPAEDTVQVDCASGDSINSAMNNAAVQLIIEISGVCVEDVRIRRNQVILRGASGDPTIDGIQEDPDSGPQRNPVDIVGFNTIVFENLHFTGGFAGIAMNASFGIDIRDSLIIDNEFTGVLAGSASGSINIVNSLITADPLNPNNFRLSRGIWAANGSNMRCIGCTVENYRTGAMSTGGSEIEISRYNPPFEPPDPPPPAVFPSVSGTRTAVALFSGGNLRSSDAELAGSTGFGFLRGGIWADSNSAAQVFGGTLLGRLVIQQNSSLLLNGVELDDNGFFNTFTGNSSAVLSGGSQLTGNVELSEFSNLTLHNGSKVSGALNCQSGADAYCENPADVGGGAATCGQCQP